MLYARNSWKDAMIEGGFDQPEAQSGCPIAFTYSQAEVRHMLRANDFLATSVTQDHICPYVVEKYVQYEYELQPWFAAMPQGMFRALEQNDLPVVLGCVAVVATTFVALNAGMEGVYRALDPRIRKSE